MYHEVNVVFVHVVVLLLPSSTPAPRSFILLFIFLYFLTNELPLIEELGLEVAELPVICQNLLPFEVSNGLDGSLVMPNGPNEVEALLWKVCSRLYVLVGFVYWVEYRVDDLLGALAILLLLFIICDSFFNHPLLESLRELLELVLVELAKPPLLLEFCQILLDPPIAGIYFQVLSHRLRPRHQEILELYMH